MKKIIVCVTALVLALALLAACGGQKPTGGNTAANDVTSFKTFAEAFALENNGESHAVYEDAFVYAFRIEDAYWRLSAALPSSVAEAIAALDIMDMDYDEKQLALIAPVEIGKCENLNEQMLSSADMEALKGKTGAELLADGWVEGMGYNLEEMEFFLEKGPFSYTVTFEAPEAPLENTDDFSVTDAIQMLQVKSVQLDGLGNAATDLPEE